MTKFNFLMVSAGFEHGGNVIHRHLDGHSRLLVYPFESQLGNRNFNDFLASVERVQYRYPEFPEGLSPVEIYEQMIDEELKTFLRKKNGSKFKDVDLVLDESQRIARFVDHMGTGPWTRRRAIEAFFRSTFEAWENHHHPVSDDMWHVGYSPAIGIDADRIVRDFPDARIMHIVRNPFSAYRDTKRRPFPQTLNKYLITWNIYHSTVAMFADMYPNNVRMFRYEDLVADKAAFMHSVADFVGIEFEPAMLYPSWNGVEISGNIAPWGTVLRSTRAYNEQVISELNEAERRQIGGATRALGRFLRYDEIDYLKCYYAE